MSDNINRELIREIVERMVEELLDEALRRDDYINSLVNDAKGAMGEYFKARYAEVNAANRRIGREGTAEGWDGEVERLLTYGFFSTAATRMRGGDPHKAFEQVVAMLRSLVPKYLMWARKQVSKDYGIPNNKMLDPLDSSTDEFFARLENLFNEALIPSK